MCVKEQNKFLRRNHLTDVGQRQVSFIFLTSQFQVYVTSYIISQFKTHHTL